MCECGTCKNLYKFEPQDGEPKNAGKCGFAIICEQGASKVSTETHVRVRGLETRSEINFWKLINFDYYLFRAVNILPCAVRVKI